MITISVPQKRPNLSYGLFTAFSICFGNQYIKRIVVRAAELAFPSQREDFRAEQRSEALSGDRNISVSLDIWDNILKRRTFIAFGPVIYLSLMAHDFGQLLSAAGPRI